MARGIRFVIGMLLAFIPRSSGSASTVGDERPLLDDRRHDWRMRRRLLALLLDWCLIVAWLAALGGAAAVAYLAGIHLSGDSASPVDLVAFLASVLPVWLYLTITEAGVAHATRGKQRAGLRVTVAPAQAGAPWPQVALRNAIKLLPWQLAHLGIVPLWLGEGTRTLVSPAVAWMPIVAAYALVGATLATMLVRADRAALHDLIAGTRVVPAFES
jgi:uncharacterized RDD family membrane protein YckC